MALNVNWKLWRETRQVCLRDGRDLSVLIGTTHTVLKFFTSATRGRVANCVSRLWIERHGQRAAGVVSAVLNRSLKLEELFPNWDLPEERPLARRECDRLREAVESGSRDLSAREMRVLRRTFGLEGQPASLAFVAREMGLTRERVRQIETAALEKLGVKLPCGRHKTTVARRRRSRLLLEMLEERSRESQPRLGTIRDRGQFAGPEPPAAASIASGSGAL